MERLIVNAEKCSSCGACLAQFALVAEDEEGRAVVAGNGLLDEDSIEEAQKWTDMCPAKAISIQTVNTTLNSKADMQEFCEKLTKKLKSIEVPLSGNFEDIDIGLDKRYVCSWDLGASVRELDFSDFVYSSYSKAKSAALQVFDRTAYSRRREIVAKILSMYKHEKLYQYYADTEDSYYAKKNKEFAKCLKEAADELEIASGGRIAVPADFAEFNALPDRYARDRLSRFETALEGPVMREFDSRSVSRNEYLSRNVDYDQLKEYDGESFFGGDKYKTKYCYTEVREAVEDLLDDIHYSVSMTAPYEADDMIDNLLDLYREEVDKLIKKKIDILEELASKAGIEELYE